MKNKKIPTHKIITYFIKKDLVTASMLSSKFKVSLPTAQKWMNELMKEGLVLKEGIISTDEGRPPLYYKLNPDKAFFVGVDIGRDNATMALMNFTGDIIKKESHPYNYNNTIESLNQFCDIIIDFINPIELSKKNIESIGINLSGRVNPYKGISYNMFTCTQEPIAQYIQEKINITTYIENDTRSILYAEKIKGEAKNKQDAIIINIDWGLGAALLANGKVIEGKSGFSGEFGHFTVFDNEVLCHCGKKGCLETEASGSAFHRILFDAVKSGKQSILSERILNEPDTITLNDMVEATIQEDMLCIEIIEQIGLKIGKYLACIINLLNPELIVLTGALSRTEGYLLRPIIAEVNKYSLSLVNQDAIIKITQLKENANVLGACLVARKKSYT